jgi:hypothetical protein
MEDEGPFRGMTVRSEEGETRVESRLRLTVAGNEFEAAGPVDEVRRLFGEWKSLMERFGARATAGEGGPETEKASSPRGNELDDKEVGTLFELDERRELVSLRSIPTSENRDGDAILFVLYGFRKILGREEVPVTSLKASLEVSGLVPGRIDRAAEPYLRDGLLLKGGKAKGGRYRLTNKGFARTEEMASALLSELR